MGRNDVVLVGAFIGLLIGASVGLILGILYSFIGAIYDISRGSVSWGTALAFLALVGMPAVFAVAGFLVGAVGTGLFQLARLARRGLGGEDQADEDPVRH